MLHSLPTHSWWWPSLPAASVLTGITFNGALSAGHRVGHYSAHGKLLTPLTKKQVKAVEKTCGGKVKTRLSHHTCKSRKQRGIRTSPPPLRLLDDLSNRTLHLLGKADICTCYRHCRTAGCRTAGHSPGLPQTSSDREVLTGSSLRIADQKTACRFSVTYQAQRSHPI